MENSGNVLGIRTLGNRMVRTDGSADPLATLWLERVKRAKTFVIKTSIVALEN